MKKSVSLVLEVVIWVLIWLCILYFLFFWWNNRCKTENPLPNQQLSEWLRWVYGIDKNINEKTIDNYLHRSDVVYRDVRMLEDSASW